MWPFSLLYGLGIQVRNLAYKLGIFKTHHLPVPIVSIGNISVGGTGKTPLAESLIRFYLSKGIQPAYLSRGYGRSSKGFLLVDPKKDSAKIFGDEALQVAMKFPGIKIAVCEDRVEGVKQLLKAGGIQVVILDDAFQHRRIHRDLNIVVIDAGRLPWQDLVLPAGRLREPRMNLKRAEFVVVNKVKDPSKLPDIKDRLSPLPAAFATPTFADSPAFTHPQRKVIAFSGLGNNAFFQKQLEQAGFSLSAFFPFPDHYRLQTADVEEIVRKYEEESGKSGKFGPPLILTTEKDYARLKDQPEFNLLKDKPFFPLPIELKWLEGWEALEQKLLDIHHA